jgi:hypothetical protein
MIHSRAARSGDHGHIPPPLSRRASDSVQRELVLPDARCPMPVTEATITCPECGAARREAMRENACQHFYPCTSCGTMLRPRQVTAAWSCSYSDQLYPPKQQSAGRG